MKKAKTPSIVFDYKEPVILSRYLDLGKIMSARLGRLTHKQQQELCRAIKKARNLALLPTGTRASDDFGRRARSISPVPFEFE